MVQPRYSIRRVDAEPFEPLKSSTERFSMHVQKVISMGEAQENLERTERMEHAVGHNKQIALLIAVIALFLALSETFGKSAQTSAISENVEASNLWAFFQAKTIRKTAVLTSIRSTGDRDRDKRRSHSKGRHDQADRGVAGHSQSL